MVANGQESGANASSWQRLMGDKEVGKSSGADSVKAVGMKSRMEQFFMKK